MPDLLKRPSMARRSAPSRREGRDRSSRFEPKLMKLRPASRCTDRLRCKGTFWRPRWVAGDDTLAEPLGGFDQSVGFAGARIAGAHDSSHIGRDHGLDDDGHRGRRHGYAGEVLSGEAGRCAVVADGRGPGCQLIELELASEAADHPIVWILATTRREPGWRRRMVAPLWS